MLTDKIIENEASSLSAYLKGCDYYRKGNIQSISYDSKEKRFGAKIVGTSFYDVNIYFDEDDKIDEVDCDCPAYYGYDGGCKHIVAVLKYIQANWNTFFNGATTSKISKNAKYLLDYFERVNDNFIINDNASIIPTYKFTLSSTGKKTNYLEFSIGNKQRMYVMRDITKFLDAVSYQNTLFYGKSFVYDPDKTVFDAGSKALLDMMLSYHEEQVQLNSDYSYNHYRTNAERSLSLDTITLHKFFEAMGNNSFEANISGSKINRITVIEENPPFMLNVDGKDGFITTSLNLRGSRYYGLDNDYRYIYHKSIIYKTTEEFSKTVKPLFKCFAESKMPEIVIPQAEASRFFANVLPQLKKISDVKVAESLQENYVSKPLSTRIYLDRLGDGVSAKIEFMYGDSTFNPLEKSAVPTFEGKTLLRNNAGENNAKSTLEQCGFYENNDIYIMNDEDKLYEFLGGGVNALVPLGEIFYSDAFKNINIRCKSKVTAGVRFNMGTDTLELTLQYENLQNDELSALLNSYKLKKRYFRLKNGSFMNIENDDSLQATATLLEHLDISNINDKIIELPKYRAMYIDSLAKEKNGLEINRCSEFKDFVDNVTKPKKDSFPLPQGINGELRDYQKTGFRWLKTLSHYGMGGILADDMGLGKTLQVIAFILSEKEKGNLPNMVVAPTSLVYNWQDEVIKFAPQLKVVAVSGTARERVQQLKDAPNADIVVTSYGLIRRDIEKYKDIKFNYCFVDEAQHIKNHNTLNSKTVKNINAKGYFALTGTPVENSLTELWSIFDFVMPGYLHNHNKFSSRYETPIVKNSDKTALKELSRHISPFIMRRLKKDVLTELPAKIESRMICNMTSEQSKLYDAYLLKARNEFEQEISESGFEKSQIKILALLTRLRQLCCHPALFLENYKGKSGKMEMLFEMLEDAKEGGHRVLLFSQFTSMLEIIKSKLEKQNISHFYLYGGTKAKDRMDMVKRFNRGETDVFLISLKAGGTGLNLTGADMVIHFDPWWNPAVEEQATDRAYRIGQKNVVQVFKLITKGSIEEKIFELQQKKRALIDSVIKPGEDFISKMNVHDIRSLFEL
jgi:superfamily II DNA or RNA helicase